MLEDKEQDKPEFDKKKWFAGRDSHSGLLLRDVEIEIRGDNNPRKLRCWRIWENWRWFREEDILTYEVSPVQEIAE